MKFSQWLLSPSKTREDKIITVLSAWSLIIVVVAAVLLFYRYLFATHVLAEVPLRSQFQMGPFQMVVRDHPFLIEFIGACVLAPLGEEIAYRLPLVMLKDKPLMIIPAMLFSSVWFGWAHALGAFAIPIQGFMGFVFAVVFVKNGFSYWSSVALHFMWNCSLLIGMYTLLS